MQLRKAAQSELPVIWEIIQHAIEQRKQEGSQQWQDGYPNEQTILDDFKSGYSYVLENNGLIMACAAIIFEEEPAYANIEGKWLSDGNYAVVHRVATSQHAKRKGVATQLFKLIEELCIELKIHSVKVYTNFDNVPMIKILDNLGYTYCGEIFYQGAPRRAYEKIIELQV